MFAGLESRLDRIEEMIRHLARPGIVVSTNPDASTVRVQLGDADNLVSYDLPVLQRQTLKNKDYAMPDVGEQVLCTFLPYGIEQGFVLGSLFSKADGVPVADQDKRHVDFEDGSWVQYDRKNHLMQAHVEQGELRVSVGKGASIVVEDGRVVFRSPNDEIDIDSGTILNLRGRIKIRAWTDGGMETLPYAPAAAPDTEK